MINLSSTAFCYHLERVSVANWIALLGGGSLTRAEHLRLRLSHPTNYPMKISLNKAYFTVTVLGLERR